MKKWIVIIGTCLLSLLAGCSAHSQTDVVKTSSAAHDTAEMHETTAEEDTSEMVPEGGKSVQAKISNVFSEAEKGVFLRGNGLIMYADKETGYCLPLCGKADCEHLPYHGISNPVPTCTAALLFKDSGGIVGEYKDSLFYIKSISEDLTDERGILCFADPAGENVIEKTEVPYHQFGFASQSLVYGQCLYTVARLFLMDENEIEFTSFRHNLYETNLETGVTRSLLETVSDITVHLRILDIRDDVLYYQDMSEEVPAIYTLSLADGEKNQILLEEPDVSLVSVSLVDNHLMYNKKTETGFDAIYRDLQTGESRTFYEDESEPMTLHAGKKNGAAYIGGTWYLYDYESGELKPIRETTEDSTWFIVGMTEDGYVVNEEGTYQYIVDSSR